MIDCDCKDTRPAAEIIAGRVCYCKPGGAGHCSVCDVCGKPGHLSCYPGPMAFSGGWCDEHFAREAQTQETRIRTLTTNLRRRGDGVAGELMDNMLLYRAGPAVTPGGGPLKFPALADGCGAGLASRGPLRADGRPMTVYCYSPSLGRAATFA